MVVIFDSPLCTAYCPVGQLPSVTVSVTLLSTKAPWPSFWAQVSVGVTVQTLVWVTIGADVVVAAIGSVLLFGFGQEYVVVVVVYELPAVVNVDPVGQLESLTAGLFTVVVTKIPVPRRCEQATVGSGLGLVEPPPPPQPTSSRMASMGVR